MSAGRDEASCIPPTSGLMKGVVPKEGDLKCILCGGKMYYDKNVLVYVCLNKAHGALAYYPVDDCYFTSREEVGITFQKEGRKFHMIEPRILAMIGLEP